MNALALLSAPSSTTRATRIALRASVLSAAAAWSVALIGVTPTAVAAEPATVKPIAKAAPKAPAAKGKATAKKAQPVDEPPTPATEEQRNASQRVYYGEYQCEFKQTLHIHPSDQHPAYVDLRFAKARYLMKPVLSSTGAIRLEDVKGQTLMVQIASKSMLLNVKAGIRLVDDCVGEGHLAETAAAKQRVALEAAQEAPGNSTSAAAKPTP